MAVRIIIDRKVKKGKESDFSKMLRELRSKAIPSKGYISGETLRAQGDPQNYVVITTWQSIEEWKAWERTPERKEDPGENRKMDGQTHQDESLLVCLMGNRSSN